MPIEGVRELKKHGITDIPQARLPWFQDFFKYLVDSSPFEENKLVIRETGSLEKFGELGTKIELIWGLIIPDQFQKRDEFGFIKQFFNYEHRGLTDSCFCEAGGKLCFQFVVFFWFVYLFPDTDFSKKYMNKLANFLKLIYVKKDVRYFDKTPEGQIQILSGHIDNFLEGSSSHEKMAFVWYLYYMECFTETSIAFDWNRMDGIASTWGTKNRRYVGVMSDRSEFLLEQLSKKGEKVKIFISHIENEKKAAIWIKERFTQVFGTSVDIFCAFDRISIPTGEEWYRWIIENILNASIVVILISPWSQNDRGLILRPVWLRVLQKE